MQHWCVPEDLSPGIISNFTKAQLAEVVSPPVQQNGKQCDIIDRDYASMTAKDIDALLNGNATDVFNATSATKPCTQWSYSSNTFGWTIVSEVSYF